MKLEYRKDIWSFSKRFNKIQFIDKNKIINLFDLEEIKELISINLNYKFGSVDENKIVDFLNEKGVVPICENLKDLGFVLTE